jgi:hypothetical protein
MELAPHIVYMELWKYFLCAQIMLMSTQGLELSFKFTLFRNRGQDFAHLSRQFIYGLSAYKYEDALRIRGVIKLEAPRYVCKHDSTCMPVCCFSVRLSESRQQRALLI